MKQSYLVVYEKGRKNFSGFVPDVPGCASAGETLEEMRANMKEALEGFMEVSADYGDVLPTPSIESITLPIAGELDPKTTYIFEFMTIKMPGRTRARRVKSADRELVAA